MSDEQRKEDETEVEAHSRHAVTEEPSDEAETEDEVEAHVRKATPRHI